MPKPRERPLPPVATRWKPGESGNPNGRPKGSKNVKTQLKRLLSVQAKKDKSLDGDTWDSLMAAALMQSAFRDDIKEEIKLRARIAIIERIEGKPLAEIHNINEEYAIDESKLTEEELEKLAELQEKGRRGTG